VSAALDTQWGKVFQSYGDGEVVMPGMEPKTVLQAAVGLTILTAGVLSTAYLLRKRK
jgi:hypothetical protein